MQKQQVLDLLTAQFTEIRDRFGVKRLALFGSTARDEAKPDSNFNIISVPASWRGHPACDLSPICLRSACNVGV